MHVLFEGQILRRRQCHTRRGNSFNRRVIGQIDKQHRPLNGAGVGQVVNKELGGLKGNAHHSEDNRKRLAFSANRCLPCQLGGHLIMRQTRTGEDGQFLAANQRVQPIDGTDTGLDKLIRIVPCIWIDWAAVNIHLLLGNNCRSVVYRDAGTAEYAAQNIRRNRQFHRLAQKANRCTADINARSAFKDLHHHLIALDLQYLAVTHRTVGQFDIHNMAVLGIINALNHHQRSGNFGDRFILFQHF